MDRPGIRGDVARVIVLCLATTVAQADTANWARKLRSDAQTGKTQCVLVSAPQRVHDGYQETWVQLEFGTDILLVLSDSNFDNTGAPPGLTVDDGEFIPVDEMPGETRLAFTGDVAGIVDQFINGNRAELRLRFWPSWPATGDKTVTFSLLGFTRAYRSQQPCK